jgi:hypothetical protein
MRLPRRHLTALDQIRALSGYWSAIYQLEAAVGGPLEP